MRVYCFFRAQMSVLILSIIMLLIAAWCSALAPPPPPPAAPPAAPTAPGLSSAMFPCSPRWSGGREKKHWCHIFTQQCLTLFHFFESQTRKDWRRNWKRLEDYSKGLWFKEVEPNIQAKYTKKQTNPMCLLKPLFLLIFSLSFDPI